MPYTHILRLEAPCRGPQHRGEVLSEESLPEKVFCTEKRPLVEEVHEEKPFHREDTLSREGSLQREEALSEETPNKVTLCREDAFCRD